jgi:hypothetical protein
MNARREPMIYACEHCGFGHVGACPRIKMIEYFENGRIKRVEYHSMDKLRAIYDSRTDQPAIKIVHKNEV